MTSSKNTTSFRMTERDYLILEDIAKCGGLTAEQIGIKHFGVAVVEGKTAIHSNCQRRMKLLREAGFVRRIERYQLLSEGKKPYLYTLTSKGAQALTHFKECSLEELNWRKKDARLRPNYVEHLIMTNDIRLAITRSVEATSGLTLIMWRDELVLGREHSTDKIPIEGDNGNERYVTLIPDAYFVIEDAQGKSWHHFLEIDRGTETTVSSNEGYRTWGRKIETYISYLYRTGLYEARYGTRNGRVLTVTTSYNRAKRLKSVTEEEGGQVRFWFAAYPDLMNISIHEYLNEQGERVRDVHMPNVVTQALWLVASKPDVELHAVSETFNRL